MSYGDCWKCCIINLQKEEGQEISCEKCCRESCVHFCKWIPVLFIWTILVWSYYVYVFIVCKDLTTSGIEEAFYLIIYHVFTIMFVWAYMKTMFVNLNTIPSTYYLTEETVEKLKHQTSRSERHEILQAAAENFDFCTTTRDGDVRYCDKCRCMKPDRTHHCSLCQNCVLKMDHHCPWTNNCVGFLNYKFFVLMLFYASLMCAFISATICRFTVDMYHGFLQHDRPQNVFVNVSLILLQFASLGFLIACFGLLIYHLCLIRKNRTTLESIYPPKFKEDSNDRGFDWGAMANFKQVFGREVWKWPLPVFTSIGDGTHFPLATVEAMQTYGATSSQDPEIG